MSSDWSRAKTMGRLEAYQDALAHLKTMPRASARLVQYLETQVDLQTLQLKHCPARIKRRAK